MKKIFQVLAIALGIVVYGCAKASGTTRAELIPGPPGVQCYAIIDSNEEVRGGNCL